MRRVRRLLVLSLMPIVLIACQGIECSAQAPWQVPVAYWPTTTVVNYSPCYDPCAAPAPYVAMLPQTTVVPPADNSGGSSCCGGASGTNGQTSNCCQKPCNNCCCCNNNDGGSNNNNVDPGNDTSDDDRFESSDSLTSYSIRRIKVAHQRHNTGAGVAGTWDSKFGPVSLRQDGNAVSGLAKYKKGGVIEMKGRYDLGVLTMEFQHRSQPDIRGKVAFHYDAKTGHLVGRTRNAVSGRETDWSLTR